MKVLAKFIIDSFERDRYDGCNVKLSAVTSGPGNESWSKYTPSGHMEMRVTSPLAEKQFIDNLGKEVYIEFNFPD